MNSEEPKFSLLESGERSRDETSGLTGVAQAKLWKYIGWFVALIGALALPGQTTNVISELHARAKWTRVTGFVNAANLRDAAQRDSPGNATGSHTFYWAEFEVSFPPVKDCGTRSSVLNAATGVITCESKIISHPERTPSDAEGWLNRHARGRPAELLYDPNGMGVKFADESLLYLVEWNKLFQGIGLVAAGTTVILVARRKLKELAENSD